MSLVAVLLAGWLVSERPMVTAERITDCERVIVSVYESGAAHFWAWNTCVEPNTIDAGLCRLSQSDIKRLAHQISTSEFATLPEIGPVERTVGEEFLSIQLWQGGKGIAKRVSSEGLARRGDDKLAKRFSALWHAVMGCCPRRSE